MWFYVLWMWSFWWSMVLKKSAAFFGPWLVVVALAGFQLSGLYSGKQKTLSAF
jgi:hypothetical protein